MSLTTFELMIQVSPAAIPLVLSSVVVDGGSPGNCWAEAITSFCRLPRTKTCCDAVGVQSARFAVGVRDRRQHVHQRCSVRIATQQFQGRDDPLLGVEGRRQRAPPVEDDGLEFGHAKASQTGHVIDVVTTAGATDISGPEFSVAM